MARLSVVKLVQFHKHIEFLGQLVFAQQHTHTRQAQSNISHQLGQDSPSRNSNLRMILYCCCKRLCMAGLQLIEFQQHILQEKRLCIVAEKQFFYIVASIWIWRGSSLMSHHWYSSSPPGNHNIEQFQGSCRDSLQRLKQFGGHSRFSCRSKFLSRYTLASYRSGDQTQPCYQLGLVPGHSTLNLQAWFELESLALLLVWNSFTMYLIKIYLIIIGNTIYLLF